MRRKRYRNVIPPGEKQRSPKRGWTVSSDTCRENTGWERLRRREQRSRAWHSIVGLFGVRVAAHTDLVAGFVTDMGMYSMRQQGPQPSPRKARLAVWMTECLIISVICDQTNISHVRTRYLRDMELVICTRLRVY